MKPKFDKWNFDGHKLLYHMDRVYDHFRDGKHVAPIHIDLGITSACNSNCVYCYARHQKKYGEIMPRQVLLDLFSDAALIGVKSIAIIGDGEPTLNPALYEAVAWGKDKGLDLSVGTNGVNLNEEKLDCLLKNLVWLRFNLSAADHDGYKRIHGTENWEKVKKNIQDAVRIKREKGYNCTIGLQMVLIPDCLDQVIKEAKFAVDEGLDYFVIKQYSNPVNPDMPNVDIEWYLEPQVTETLQIAEALSTDKTAIVPKYTLMKFHDKKPYKRCVDLPLLLEISGTGKCYPCGYHFRDERYCFGDLNRNSLEEIVASDHYWELIRAMRERFEVGKDCMGCCRHDQTNDFIWNYLKQPEHINFI